MKAPFSKRCGKDGKFGVETPDTHFREPDLGYAPTAFWFWNGPLKRERIAWMAKEMSRQRLNPGYVHARHYKAHEPFWLSDDWFTCFQAALESAAAGGTRMSYTMGDPCFPDKYLLPDHPEHPNFPVGGTLPPRHPELKSVSLAWTAMDVQGGAGVEVPASFFAVAARLDGGGRLLSSTLEIIGEGDAFPWTAPQCGSWRVYSFTAHHDCQHSGGTSINFLDRRLAEPWLKLENAKYEELFSRYFGTTMEGVFFDLEGSFGYKLAWSDDLAKDYLRLKDVDIRLRMPLLAEEDAEGLWAKARWDWFDVVGHVYVDCVFAPLERWCRERGLFMTCHFWEERLFQQAVYVANFMGAQRSSSMPGTDALFRNVHKPRTFKETQSVCEFEGRQFMCEVLGIAGWHLTTAELKTAANSAIAQGLTHIVPHGINTSDQLREVSYPPDFFEWNPYWRHFHLWTDFARRACHVNDHGHLAAETLLLCPMDSVWALIGDAYFESAKPFRAHISDASDVGCAHAAEIMAIDDAYTQAMNDMYASRIDHLVADSHYIMEMSVGDDATLSRGPFAFTSLVLPPLKLLPLEVARRIADFAQAGGHVFALGSLPNASAENGVGDPAMKRLMDTLRKAPSFIEAGKGLRALIDLKAPGLAPCVTFETGEFPLIASKRIVNGRSFIWLANNEPAAHEFILRVRGASGEVSIWDCETGTVRSISSEDLADGSRVALTLEPFEAFWLVHDPSKPALPQKAAAQFEEVMGIDALWTVCVDPTDQPNLAQHKLAAPEWLLQGGAARPLESWLKWDLRRFSGFVDYTTTFDLPDICGSEILDLGQVKHMAQVWINGENVGSRMWPPFKFEIGTLLRKGRNTIRVQVGNLIVNAVTQYENYDWKWHTAPDTDTLDAGLFGPVTLRRPSLENR